MAQTQINKDFNPVTGPEIEKICKFIHVYHVSCNIFLFFY